MNITCNLYKNRIKLYRKILIHSHIKEVASRKKITRFNDASKEMVYFLSKHTALCIRNVRCLSLCLSFLVFLTMERAQMLRVEERCTTHAASFYTRDSVTTRFPP